MKKNIELLAPAGSLEKLKIAIARLEKFVNKLREEQKQ